MFTLFNLQGALGVFHRFVRGFIGVLGLGAELIHIITSFSFCQALFSFSFKMFQMLFLEISVIFASLEAACT